MSGQGWPSLLRGALRPNRREHPRSAWPPDGDMTRRLLLVSTATRWLGTARMPRVLARAGFEVSLLAPKDSLATKSRYLTHIGILPVTATPSEWLRGLVQMVEKVSPQMLVPCDEMAIRLLFTVALTPPPGLASMRWARLVRLIAASLGDPQRYAVSIDKTLLPSAAQALGVRVPPYALAARIEDAIEHAAALHYPVVLKRRFGFAGQGVAVVSTPTELADAAQQLMRPDPLDLGEPGRTQLLVQAYIDGPHHSQALVALRGVPVAGFAWERHVATSPVKGQTTVLRFVNSRETRDFSEALCRGFGMSGFFNVQFVIDQRSGAAHLLEINRRLVTHMHMGERVGEDLGRALFDALEGNARHAMQGSDEGSGESVVVFPREWLRDPESRLLTELPVDLPWDEPELLVAMLAMRHEE